MNFLKNVLGSPCNITIDLEGIESRETTEVANQEGKVEKLPIYVGNEAVKGTINIKLEPSTKKN